MYRWSHNKVITSRFSVVNIDGTVVQFILSIIMPGSIDTLKAEFWFWLSVIKILVLRRMRQPINILMPGKLIESQAFQTTEQYPSSLSTLLLSII